MEKKANKSSELMFIIAKRCLLSGVMESQKEYSRQRYFIKTNERNPSKKFK